MNERRSDRGDLPTKLEISLAEMDPDDRNRLQWIGAVLILAGLVVPLGVGAFVHLPVVYWIFSGFVAFVGVLLAWPRAGVYILTSAPGAIRTLIPHPKVQEMLTPVDRRKSDDA